MRNRHDQRILGAENAMRFGHREDGQKPGLIPGRPLWAVDGLFRTVWNASLAGTEAETWCGFSVLVTGVARSQR